ncbi:hypothetical protein [uncultured Methanobrevibacter sp.]|uniref:hypothetical protein n=1 Tax=uncultured Methanobrevibacter sp. TaxID=253161 RepID=UPI0025DE5AFB|nr:hypothetical protein [uncultured Methanobrevibacter sp.]
MVKKLYEFEKRINFNSELDYIEANKINEYILKKQFLIAKGLIIFYKRRIDIESV